MYSEIVLNKISPLYKKLEPMFFSVMLVISIINFIVGKLNFAIICGIISLYFLIMLLIGSRFSVRNKLIVSNSLTFILGAYTISQSGFSATGIIVFLIATLSCFIYLPSFHGWLALIGTTLYMIVIFILIKTNVLNYSHIDYASRLTNSVILSTIIGYVVLVGMIARSYMLTYKTLSKSLNEVTKLAYYDSLSGIPNKENLKRHYIKGLNKKKLSGFLVLIDLKDFKITKSFMGHKISKEYIKCLSEVFLTNLNDDFYTAKISENVFLSYINVDSIKDITEKINQIFHEFKTIFTYASSFRELTYFLSIVNLEDQMQSFEDAVSKAEIALTYGFKHNRSNYIVFEDFMATELHKKEHMVKLLEQAIFNDSFEIYYQEKVDSNTEKVIGLEALARWFSDELGNVSPGLFIPLIEEGSHVRDFGLLILKKVMLDFQTIDKKYSKDVTVSINVSPSHLMTSGFIQNLEEIINKYNIDTKRIVLEITEEVFIDNVEYVSNILISLRDKGFKISLDDFGSGYSSLNYLAFLPFDEIKIDQSFTRQLIKSEKVASMIQTIFHISSLYNYNLVVEGVEQKQEVEYLKRLGNCSIQGYYYSKPVPLK